MHAVPLDDSIYALYKCIFVISSCLSAKRQPLHMPSMQSPHITAAIFIFDITNFHMSIVNFMDA